MRIVFKLLALVLLTVWLPATQHCALEAAGVEFFAHCEHDSSSCEDACAKDGCHAIEGASFSKYSTTIRALPPASFQCFCLLHLLTPPLAVDRYAVFTVDDPPEVQALLRTWQFVRRTALPARAPDYRVV